MLQVYLPSFGSSKVSAAELLNMMSHFPKHYPLQQEHVHFTWLIPTYASDLFKIYFAIKAFPDFLDLVLIFSYMLS